MTKASSAAEHLSEAITFETVSHSDSRNTDYEPYSAFLDFLERTYQASIEIWRG